MTSSVASLGLPALSPVLSGLAEKATPALTVRQVIDIIMAAVPGERLPQTVDTLKSGNPGQPVTGIVTTMFATLEVIRRATELKANFIIAHEPTFYNHLDDTAWLQDDGVFRFKQELLNNNNIAVWRFHDYWHQFKPDGIRTGVVNDLGWQQYSDASNPRLFTIPDAPLSDIVSHVKKRLGIHQVRMIGDPQQMCRRVLLMPGASGGRVQISQLKASAPDVIICGEVAEWETSEYIRDAIAMGLRRSLLVLGHAQSEEPGMRWLREWLGPKVPGIAVTHVPSGNPFTWA